jgi:hypothetical protein
VSRFAFECECARACMRAHVRLLLLSLRAPCCRVAVAVKNWQLLLPLQVQSVTGGIESLLAGFREFVTNFIAVLCPPMQMLFDPMRLRPAVLTHFATPHVRTAGVAGHADRLLRRRQRGSGVLHRRSTVALKMKALVTNTTVHVLCSCSGDVCMYSVFLCHAWERR